MTPLSPAEASVVPVSAELAIVTAFEHRVATRDEPKAEPLLFDAASVQERLRRALRVRLRQRDPRRLRRLASICYHFLAAPTQLSTDPAVALSLSPSALTRTWRELREAGLVELVPAGRQRGYRLTRAGEDWLLAVVKGEADPR